MMMMDRGNMLNSTLEWEPSYEMIAEVKQIVRDVDDLFSRCNNIGRSIHWTKQNNVDMQVGEALVAANDLLKIFNRKHLNLALEKFLVSKTNACSYCHIKETLNAIINDVKNLQGIAQTGTFSIVRKLEVARAKNNKDECRQLVTDLGTHFRAISALMKHVGTKMGRFSTVYNMNYIYPISIRDRKFLRRPA